ncbi:MAG: hypothetical protein JEZ04_08860 [Spirochaetales bacterium]|nr:hypothetical protein [Spirochaetales bacterium]
MADFTKKILTLSMALLTFFPLLTSADEPPLLPAEEAQDSFVKASLGTEDVMLFLTGSWNAEIWASTGFGWSPEAGFDTTIAYPGMESGFSFFQTPDFTASLSIFDRYLFEAAFTDELEDSTFRLGYQGRPGEFLQTISAGNMGINLSEDAETSDFFYVPDGGPSSFGFYSSFNGGGSSHELLLRFDPDKEHTKVYIGTDSVTEIELEVSDYLRERFYYLPGAPASAAFYIESTGSTSPAVTLSSGTIVRSFKKLSADAYSYSPITGLLYLKKKPEGILLAYSADFDWTAAVDNDYISGHILSDFQKTTSAGPMLCLSDKGDIVLTNAGEFSPFESAAAYNINTVLPEDSWKTRVYLAPSSSSLAGGIELNVSPMADAGIILLHPAGGGNSLYPLESLTSDLRSVYGPEALKASDNNYLKLITVIREESTSYTLDDPVPGTVRIYINGRETFNWDLSGNTVTFDTEPGNEDRIEIIYRKANSGETGGDLLFASANRFSITEGLSAAFNAGFRWNVLSGTYALPTEENSGYLNTSASFNYDNSAKDGDLQITAGITAGLKIQSDNSAGILVLKNMSDDSLGVNINSNLIFPASPSSYIGLLAGDRGLLYYKDYRINTSALSDGLQDYNDVIDESMIYSPDESTAADKYKAGPYTTAAQKDGKSGEVLVMDWVLPSSGSWAGVQIPISRGSANTDLSGYNSVSFDCKSEGDLSGVEFYLEIGAVSEDLDADGVLDSETGQYSSGFTFNDKNTVAGTLIGGDSRGGGNNILDTEDINNNGFIDIDKSDAVAVFTTDASDNAYDADLVIPGSAWSRVRLYFSGTSESDRARLKNAEFVRITAVSTAAGEKTGRILIDDLRFEGKSLFPDSEAGLTEPNFSEIEESLTAIEEKSSSPLIYPYKNSADDNQVMRIDWAAPWRLYSVLSPIKYNDYGSIVFYIHVPELGSSPTDTSILNFRMTDTGGSGIAASIPFSETSSWQKIEIKPSDNEIYIDDILSPAALLSVDTSAGSLIRLEIEVNDASSGILYIDEIHLLNPALNTTAGVTADFSMASGTPLLSAGALEIIGASSLISSLSYTAVDEDQLVSDLDLYTGVKTRILGTDAALDISWENITGNSRLSAAHDIKIPLIGSYLSISDSFRTDNAGGGDFTKTDNININAGPVSGRLAGFSATLNTGLLTQQWNSELSAAFSPFSISSSCEMLLSGTGYSGTWDNYFSGWASATVLAGVFDNSSLRMRKTSLKLSPVLATKPLGIKANLSLGAGITDSRYFDSAELKLGLPVNFQLDNSEFSMEIGYVRSAEFFDSAPVSLPVSFAEDLAGLFSLLAGRQYLYSSIPVAELFSDSTVSLFSTDCLTAGIDEAVFGNSLYFSLSRDYSSRIIDLFLPHTLSIELGRDLVQDFTETEDELNFTLSCRTTARNLFGTAGAYSAFDFYYSDEFSWSVDAVLSRLTDAVLTQEYFIEGGISIFGFEDQTLSLDTDLYIPVNKADSLWSFTENLLYIWNFSPEVPLDLPLFTEEEEALQIFTNEEKILIGFDTVFRTELKHVTSLIIPQTLTLSAFGSIGYKFNTLSENNISLFGFSAGVSASIFY